MQSTLPLVLQAFKFDSLARNEIIADRLKKGMLTAEISGILDPNLAVYKIGV